MDHFRYLAPRSVSQERRAEWIRASRSSLGKARAELGFVDEGRLRQVFRRDGQWHDMFRMGLLEGELR